eukprot:2708504-Alexandrium_andersonii.AAC.1
MCIRDRSTAEALDEEVTTDIATVGRQRKAASEVSDGGQDYWERGVHEWTRVHMVPRTHLFVPEE